MKSLFIILLCVVGQAAYSADLLFDNEQTQEQTATAGARDCKKCSKPKCGGCTRR